MPASRLAQAAPAVRPSLKARLMISGPSGAGKTWSALQIARALVGPKGSILFIDTEQDSALTYADQFDFTHLPWDAPFSPLDLGQTILDAGKAYDATVIDSLSHFWTKSGGVLDIADGRFGGWKVARPAQQDMVDAILGAGNHVLLAVRSKMEYAQETGSNGRQVVTKLGMEPIQDATLVYEMNVAVEMDMEHRLAVSKSRATAVPVGTTFQPGHAPEFGLTYGDWLAGGTQVDAPDADALMAQIQAMPEDFQAEIKAKWMERGLPKPAALTPHQILRVLGIIEQVASDHAAAAKAASEAVTADPSE